MAVVAFWGKDALWTGDKEDAQRRILGGGEHYDFLKTAAYCSHNVHGNRSRLGTFQGTDGLRYRVSPHIPCIQSSSWRLERLLCTGMMDVRARMGG